MVLQPLLLLLLTTAVTAFHRSSYPIKSYLSSKKSSVITMGIKSPVRYSTQDWWDCLVSLPSSRILARTKKCITFFTLWALLVTIAYKFFRLQFTLPASINSVLGSALGLLLVFRTNSSYDRFWEARKAQSSVVMACRNIASHAYTHVPKINHAALAAMLTAYVIIQKQHLQGVTSIQELEPLKKYLSKSSHSDVQNILENISKKRNPPLYVLRTLESFIHHSLMEKYRDPEQNSLTSPKYIEKHFIELLHVLSNSLAICERILKQPVPLDYSRHTSRFLSLYLLALPFNLVTSLGWLTVPIISAVCWSFVSVQEIGHFIEEPFDKETQVIPLNQIVSVVRLDVSEILDGVIESPELDSAEAVMFRETLNNSREKESFFSYYMEPQ